MRILVISDNYPSVQNPGSGAFVYNLMQELALYHEITIIAPQKEHHRFQKKHETYGQEKCNVTRPGYFSFSNKKFGPLDTYKWTTKSFKNAVLKDIHKLIEKPDLIYVHFLRNAGPVLKYAKENNIPLVAASGESSYTSWERNPIQYRSAFISKISHIICVSKENKEQLIDLGFDSSKISIIPNAVNYDFFKPMDQKECKEKLAIPADKFVVGFIGHFIHRKGPNRVIQAIEKLDDADIQLVCVGGGGKLKENSFTKIIPPVPNGQLPEIYNAFDIFVLPTLHEGNCNVIEEAKACGIPIVSSKGTSVEEQIDQTTGILVDPLNIDELSKAIEKLKENLEFRLSIHRELIKLRGGNSIKERAQKINLILEESYKNINE